MTATSVFAPSAAPTARRGGLRLAALVFAVVLVFSAIAFAVGRGTAHARHTTVIAPSSLSAQSGTPAGDCQIILRHAC